MDIGSSYSYTYGDLLFVQLQIWTLALHTVTPMETCSSYRCAVTQHICIAALFRAKCSFHFSVLLCKTGSQQARFLCDYTYGDLLFIQMCSDPAQMHCSSVQGKMQFPLFSAALQNRLTASSVSLQLHIWIFALHTGVLRAKRSFHSSVLLCKTGSQQAVFHCSYTYGHLLFIQVCSDPAHMHCSSIQGKMQFPLLSAALQNRLTAGKVSLRLHLWRLALHTGVQ
ncbi:TPA: hypothetical protein ACH3X1_016528 [Trebouxia sp. C0004]